MRIDIRVIFKFIAISATIFTAWCAFWYGIFAFMNYDATIWQIIPWSMKARFITMVIVIVGVLMSLALAADMAKGKE